ncbi:MAG: sodium/proton-translocating pyrophosphatase, partial [Proteobacteria bacterium]|nr:sodium/proton-translocating pyrophosphatase [Pseudomonadota bacterium]
MLVAYEIYNSILTHPTGSAKAREIQQEFQDGLKLFLKIENRNFFYFVVVFLIGILIFNHNGFWTSFTFCLGVLLSALSSRLGLLSASEANIRAANAAREKGQGDALFLAFGGGSIMGLAIANFSLIGIGVLFYFFNSTENISNLCGFALGANIFALYVRFCGGNLLNAAETSFDNINDLSTDLAEDDLRNPVFIVKKIANQIANIAASATDFFDSNVTAIIASMIIASFLSKENLGDLTSISADSSAEDTLRFNFILMSVPLILSTLGLISSLIGIKLIKNFKDEDPIKAFKVATWISTFLYVFFSLLMFVFFIPVKFSIWWTVLIGAFCSVLIPKITEYFTTSRPIGKVINASFTSAQRSILSAISVGLNNAWTILIVLAFALLLADYFAGIYGVSIAAISMLATVGITISIDTYCPIINDAKVIAKMSDYNPEAHEIIEHLHKLGQNTL